MRAEMAFLQFLNKHEQTKNYCLCKRAKNLKPKVLAGASEDYKRSERKKTQLSLFKAKVEMVKKNRHQSDLFYSNYG